MDGQCKISLCKYRNLTHLIHNTCTKIDIQCAPNGIGLILAGRIKGGHMKTRFNALCVSSFSNRILDIGYISSVSSLGLVGVKVGLKMWV